jgi:predicted nucleic acid-binding protein
MRYVLDSNVALKWGLPEADASMAIRIRDEFRMGIHELLAPDVFTAEIGHALTRSERRGLIQPTDGAQKLSDILASLPDLYPSLPIITRAYQISSQARRGIYDCLYVALAEREGCELLTADDWLIRSLQPAFPFITSLASFP